LTEAPGNAVRYPVRTRFLHWLSAVLIFAGLFVGFVMVNSIGSYRTLVGLHMTLGVTILTIAVVRIANRSTQRAVTLPDTVANGPGEGRGQCRGKRQKPEKQSRGDGATAQVDHVIGRRRQQLEQRHEDREAVRAHDQEARRDETIPHEE